jgi:hypothetical protein
MRSLLSSIGPEEAGRRVAILKILLALEEGARPRIRVRSIHRTLTVVKSKIDSANRMNQISSLQRMHLTFDLPHDGRFRSLDGILKELALYRVIDFFTNGDDEYITFHEKSRFDILETIKRLCEMRQEEETVFDQLATWAAQFYDRLVRGTAGYDD